MIRALVFDFDGLILDTEEPIFQAWQEVFRAHGLEFPFEKWAATIGTAEPWYDPLDDLEEQSGQKLDRQAILAQQRRREAQLILEQPVKPGVQEYLETARRLGLQLGLASSSTCAWVEGHLSRLGLIEYFDCIRASDDVPRTKPDPELYLAALEGLETRPEQAIAFEDSPNGVLAARRAGLWCVVVPNALTRRLALDQANLRLDSLADLPLETLLKKFA